MTALVARAPLHPLSMSSAQSGTRRLSARLQDKHDVASAPNGAQARDGMNKKRKNISYEEEDDGFVFSRVKKQKSQVTQPDALVLSSQALKDAPLQQRPTSNGEAGAQQNEKGEDWMEAPKKRRNKMSFSTPRRPEAQPIRRSKRLSGESDKLDGSPQFKTRRKADQLHAEKPAKDAVTKRQRSVSPEKAARTNASEPAQSPPPREQQQEEQQHVHKIALPFADTPVIRRNKAMREGKSGNGERRSSLGFRGRRASSLIESGNSNALPHGEVEICDFYKHIESEGLPEPRRMKQLLTWCATRALDAKPVGTDFEDASARSAARVIQEELLKDLSNKSELSDWFSRQDEPVSTVPLPERPNPKNVQNEEKVLELEEQIEQLRAQKDALEALLQPPSIPELSLEPDINDSEVPPIDRSLLSESDATLLDSLQPNSNLQDKISQRLNSITSTLGPSIDTFADGVNSIARYRDAADSLANRVLAICSSRLSEREKEGRRKALQQEEDRSPARDLNSVLRSLSHIDR